MGKIIKVEELKPDMIIDKDVSNMQGAVLLRKGNVISEKHIKIFKTWGVKSVFIQSDEVVEDMDGKDPQAVAEEKLKELQNVLDEKFSDVIGYEVMQQIKAIAFKHRERNIKAKYKV